MFRTQAQFPRGGKIRSAGAAGKVQDQRPPGQAAQLGRPQHRGRYGVDDRIKVRQKLFQRGQRYGMQPRAARCAGLHAIPLTALEQLLPHFDAVINTIPAPVLGAAQLRCLPRGALILDLASRPGGTDFAAARELGLRAEHALSLPARCAPETAGALVAHTVEVILQERAATARSERGVS